MTLLKLSPLKKYLIIIFFLSLSIGLYSQIDMPKYALFNGTKPYIKTHCLTKDFDFNDLKIKLVKGDDFAISKTIVNITLTDNKTHLFSDYTAFKDFNLKNWLANNNAFNKTTTLIFEFETEMIDGKKKYQVLSICIKKTNLTRNLNPVSYDKQPDFIRMPVYFATDRNDTKSNDVNNRFGGKRGMLQYGTCVVTIPYDHKIGEIERPSLWRLEFSEDSKKHVVLESIKVLNKDSYFKKLSNNIKKTSKKSSFLFVHGYNVSFAAAARRTAQISYDLLFDGEAVFYSWPSQSNTAAYTIDEANIAWSEANIKNFLEDYLTRSEADDIYLVAHSMGNRGLTKAIVSLFTEKPELKNRIKEIILAAPDIDADVFKRDIAPQMVSKIKKPITLYVSSNDMALQASHQVHGNARAGDSGKGVIMISGIETIDASGIDTSFLGHSYFAESTSIIADIFDLIKTGKRAYQREKLKLIKVKDQMYFKVMGGF
ncbi:MAG: alpha/beta hydrolase [Flavobacteriaceae bacterium]|nr:alpha/beta hydrolase [Flavobacteriaceae bacterium]